ncbi:hypothetical protein SNEBB_009168 [Seison nebaliae]|nr:hypothetical protein SNEBB_009168 [Seison nebaliae]
MKKNKFCKKYDDEKLCGLVDQDVVKGIIQKVDDPCRREDFAEGQKEFMVDPNFTYSAFLWAVMVAILLCCLVLLVISLIAPG